jgi:hypothetical protein
LKPSQTILGIPILIKKMMHNKINPWKACLLLKFMCLFLLSRLNGWSV